MNDVDKYTSDFELYEEHWKGGWGWTRRYQGAETYFPIARALLGFHYLDKSGKAARDMGEPSNHVLPFTYGWASYHVEKTWPSCKSNYRAYMASTGTMSLRRGFMYDVTAPVRAAIVAHEARHRSSPCNGSKDKCSHIKVDNCAGPGTSAECDLTLDSWAPYAHQTRWLADWYSKALRALWERRTASVSLGDTVDVPVNYDLIRAVRDEANWVAANRFVYPNYFQIDGANDDIPADRKSASACDQVFYGLQENDFLSCVAAKSTPSGVAVNGSALSSLSVVYYKGAYSYSGAFSRRPPATPIEPPPALHLGRAAFEYKLAQHKAAGWYPMQITVVSDGQSHPLFSAVFGATNGFTFDTFLDLQPGDIAGLQHNFSNIVDTFIYRDAGNAQRIVATATNAGVAGMGSGRIPPSTSVYNIQSIQYAVRQIGRPHSVFWYSDGNGGHRLGGLFPEGDDWRRGPSEFATKINGLDMKRFSSSYSLRSPALGAQRINSYVPDPLDPDGRIWYSATWAAQCSVATLACPAGYLRVVHPGADYPNDVLCERQADAVCGDYYFEDYQGSDWDFCGPFPFPWEPEMRAPYCDSRGVASAEIIRQPGKDACKITVRPSCM